MLIAHTSRYRQNYNPYTRALQITPRPPSPSTRMVGCGESILTQTPVVCAGSLRCSVRARTVYRPCHQQPGYQSHTSPCKALSSLWVMQWLASGKSLFFSEVCELLIRAPASFSSSFRNLSSQITPLTRPRRTSCTERHSHVRSPGSICCMHAFGSLMALSARVVRFPCMIFVAVFIELLIVPSVCTISSRGVGIWRSICTFII